MRPGVPSSIFTLLSASVSTPAIFVHPPTPPPPRTPQKRPRSFYPKFFDGKVEVATIQTSSSSSLLSLCILHSTFSPSPSPPPPLPLADEYLLPRLSPPTPFPPLPSRPFRFAVARIWPFITTKTLRIVFFSSSIAKYVFIVVFFIRVLYETRKEKQVKIVPSLLRKRNNVPITI